MNETLFRVSSITNVQRGQKVLSANGISSKIERVSKPKAGDGCGYVIVVNSKGALAENLLRESGIRIVGIDKR